MWATFDHRGTQIATGNAEGLVELWNLDGDRLATLRGHATVVQGVEFSPDDRRVLSTSNDRTARVWDISSRTELVRVTHKDEVDAARFEAHGSWFATASADKSVVLWETATGRPIRAFLHESAVRSVGFNRVFLAGATSSGTIQLWDLNDGREVGRFLHTAIAQAVDFDGDRMLTTGLDGRIVIWDVSIAVGSLTEVTSAVCRLLSSSDVTNRDMLQCERGKQPHSP